MNKKVSFTQPTIIKATMAIQKDREKVEKRLAAGDSLTEIGFTYNITPKAFKNIAEASGIAISRRTKSSLGSAQNAIVTVLTRLCKQLEVDSSELEPYRGNGE